MPILASVSRVTVEESVACGMWLLLLGNGIIGGKGVGNGVGSVIPAPRMIDCICFILSEISHSDHTIRLSASRSLALECLTVLLQSRIGLFRLLQLRLDLGGFRLVLLPMLQC